MDIRSGETLAADATDTRMQALANPDGDPAPAAHAGPDDLPIRPVPQCRLLHQIRRMDDPEILQRVLAGLLTLP